MAEPTKRKTDIGPPHYEKFLPPIIRENYGKWKFHEIPRPGVVVLGICTAMISTRRLFFLFAAVSFGATGFHSPWPAATMCTGSSPRLWSSRYTVAPRCGSTTRTA